MYLLTGEKNFEAWIIIGVNWHERRHDLGSGLGCIKLTFMSYSSQTIRRITSGTYFAYNFSVLDITYSIQRSHVEEFPLR